MIEIKSLSKAFKLTRQHRRELGDDFAHQKSIQAVNDISFTCNPGQIFGLIGPNGAGKTTTLRMVATMLKPTKGTIAVAGFDTVKDNQKVREKIGFMTGQTALYDRLTPNEMVQYMAELHGMDKAKFKTRRQKLFDVLDMHDFADRRIARLSTGMKQKTSIARTIIHDPEVMVFDEPTSGLDVMTSRAIMDLIRDCKAEGKTVLFSTHRMGEINQVCDDIAIIFNGKLYFNGTLDQFKSEMTQPTFEDEFIYRVEGK
ncbi:MAG: ATP-binding cassette domain-containing protein [Candidatus Marinimicrobia bacterium]|jgi:sodium transport system ATP-binding protein|nr:ATP-binding cassette domain-containing protein [Candidatus Neomarinimicrobiota bacterium]MBT3496023.1 ATP-binding cassette domain-containing protein [Candidatus Neomarinimicrobiota bacterium]MBT3691732.1 ATP-binding cassette domain-containing protein [Candidatus Neomarinimicrobiota bacterium]MBT3732667.1 ATP-binding cassette domain-containing protein [Candidatus Neomarinimicrobiota bacterium]MBT4143980.1 ATP-binding cassette domain-containing protein [Candidatus Neomarinimicrobiota bacterium